MPDSQQVDRRNLRARQLAFKIINLIKAGLAPFWFAALTTNLRRAKASGNVLLDENEADLPKQGVVVVSQLLTVDKSQLIDKIGTLSKERIEQIVEGVKYLIEPREI